MISYIIHKLIFCSSEKEHASEFSVQEIAAIKDVWMRLRARNKDVGVKILAALIEKKPNFALYYGFETSLAVEELQKGAMFILQARRIQNFLDTIVSSLGFFPDSSIHHMSYRIGQIHYHRGVNFGADNWLVFKKVTIDQVLSAQKKSTMFNGSLKEVEKVEDTAYNKPAQNIRIDQSAKIINKQATRHVTYEQSNNLDSIRHGSPGKTKNAAIGWNKLMSVIIREMKRGFLDEARRNCEEDAN